MVKRRCGCEIGRIDVVQRRQRIDRDEVCYKMVAGLLVACRSRRDVEVSQDVATQVRGSMVRIVIRRRSRFMLLLGAAGRQLGHRTDKRREHPKQ